MRNPDKLDRWRTRTTAVLTMNADVPFWVCLTQRERTVYSGVELRQLYQQCGQKRKQFRDFIRCLCAKVVTP